MALDPENFGPFSGKINAADANYTYGSGVDVTAPSAGDGTPWVEGFINDTFGWQQALLDEVGIIPSGAPDTAIASQYLEAMIALILQQGTNDSPIIVDGGFNIWPEALTFAVTSSNYTANNFLANSGNLGGGTATVSRQDFIKGQTDVPGNPQYFLNFNQTVSPISGRSELDHRVEFAETLSDTTMTFKFFAKASAALNVDVVLRQNFGTGGGPSAEVEVAGPTVAVTTLWQKFTVTIAVPSVSGKTFGTDLNDYFSLALTVDNAEGIFDMDTTNWSIGQGEFVNQSFERIQSQCQRYFEKSYTFDQDVGSVNVGNLRYTASGNQQQQFSYNNRVIKRGVPVGIVYSETGAINMIRDVNTSTDVAGSIVGVNANIFRISKSSASVDQRIYAFHYTLDARL